MRANLAYFVGIGVASGAGWFAHSLWASAPQEAPGNEQQMAAGELVVRLDQLQRQQHRQLNALVAMQRDLTGLLKVAHRAESDDALPVAASNGGEDEPAAEDFLPTPTVEQTQAASEAEAIVHQATLAGRWTDQDSHRLEEQLQRMDPEDSQKLRRNVIAALNRGELEIAFSGRPAF